MSLGEQTLAWRRVEKGIHRLGAECLANEFLDSQALAPAEITGPDDGEASSSPLTSRRHFDEHVMQHDASSCALDSIDWPVHTWSSGTVGPARPRR